VDHADPRLETRTQSLCRGICRTVSKMIIGYLHKSLDRLDQEIVILSLHLLQICMVYINTLLVQKVLSEKEWLDKMQPEDFRGQTPLFYGHVNPYGRLVLNMNERIIIE
jgi:hypothetical protein